MGSNTHAYIYTHTHTRRTQARRVCSYLSWEAGISTLSTRDLCMGFLMTVCLFLAPPCVWRNPGQSCFLKVRVSCLNSGQDLVDPSGKGEVNCSRILFCKRIQTSPSETDQTPWPEGKEETRKTGLFIGQVQRKGRKICIPTKRLTRAGKDPANTASVSFALTFGGGGCCMCSLHCMVPKQKTG